MSILRIIFVLLLILIFARSAHAELDLADRSAERWRLVQELEYQDEEIIPLRIEARAAQGAYSTAAQQLMSYVRSYHEDYRKEERKLSDLSSQRQFWQEQIPVLQRELNLAQELSDADRIQSLEQELSIAEQRISDLMGDWVAQQQQLQQLLADLADDDPRLAALRNLRDQREKEAAEAAQILNNTVREHPRLRQFDHQAVDQLPLEYLPSAQD